MVALAAACGSTKKGVTTSGTGAGASGSATKTSCAESDLNLFSPGELTIAQERIIAAGRL